MQNLDALLSKDKASLSYIARLLWRIFRHVSQKRRRQFILLLCLTFVGSFAEVISLGAIIPFIGILTQPEVVFNYPLIAESVHILGFSSAQELVLPLTIAFVVAALFAGGIRLLLLWVGIRFANSTGADISILVYRRTLYQTYAQHTARSSSDIISGITQKVVTTTGVLMSVVSIITSVVLFLTILLTLFIIDPLVAGVAIICFGSSYGLIAWNTRARLTKNSICIARQQTEVIKALQEGLGAIRDVLLDGTQEVYSSVYSKSIRQLRQANAENIFINQAPRYVMEVMGMVLIAILAFTLSYKSGGVAAALPVLGALALGAQRLLPLLQQLFSGWSLITGSHAALLDVVELLEQPAREELRNMAMEPLPFMKTIQFDKVYFKYNLDGPTVLDDFSLVIQKGSRVGLIGSTGSGKSTVLDLLMGLLAPTAGAILVDDTVIDGGVQQAWQRTIAHVPQSIFLADASIAENIAFGYTKSDIDMVRVKKAAAQSQCAEFIESNPEGYNAVVGERGIRLSGGQRQRIGIARALYKQATVLVLDEATSALDSATEQEVMGAIESLDRDLTVLMIAHRVTTLKHCDTILRLEQGRIVEQGSYDQLVQSERAINNVLRVAD